MARVTVKRLIKHFGSKSALARAAGVTKQAVGQWGNRIPEASAKRLARSSDCPWTLQELPVKKLRTGPKPNWRRRAGRAA